MFIGINLSVVGGLRSSTAVYNVNGLTPEVVADFTRGFYRTGGATTTFADMFTFARASGATYTDANGVLQTAASGVARVGNHVYDGSAWINEGLLLESEARTNLILQSSDFATSWNKTNATVSTNQIASPSGSVDADKIVSSAATASQAVDQAVTVTSLASAHTASVFFKSAEFNYILVRLGDNTLSNFIQATFRSDTGVMVSTLNGGTGSLSASKIESVGGGWYRASVSGVPSSGGGTTARLRIYVSHADTTAATGDGTSGAYLWGAQLELGSTRSSYIPTTTAAATRAAETLTIAAAKMAYSATAMSMQMDGTMTGATSTLGRWYSSATAYITQSAGSSAFSFAQYGGGALDTVTGGSFTSGVNVPFNVASRHGSTFINGAASGTALTADTTPVALPDLSATNFSLGYAFMGNIGQFRQWAADIGDTGIAEASA